MLGIFITAIITTVGAILIFGSLLLAGSHKEDRKYLVLATLLTLPLQPLAFYLVRLPLNSLIVQAFPAGSFFYSLTTTFYAPLTEEPAKLLPLLLPFLTATIHPKNFVRFAMALGLGFGIGEMWFVAEMVSRNPEYATMPWYLFGGYIFERLLVCFAHAGFTSVFLWRLGKKSGLGWGLLGAMGLHYLANFPIFLSNLNIIPLDQSTWSIAMTTWLVLIALFLAGMLARFSFGKWQVGRFLNGLAKCPECGTIYPRPLFAVNMLNKRYERCPNCHKFHMTETYKEKPGDGDNPPTEESGFTQPR